jgi:subtilisin family serine protease
MASYSGLAIRGLTSCFSVAGTIAAMDNDIGVVGVVPGVDLYIVRVFNESCRWTYVSSLIDALNRCTSAGANIVSMSLS